MSNPTTPFGWQMPTNTDLVTDLPADFEVFGQAVATSMQDLLGGTTGQVLAKASNTDMDFVWSADAAGMTNPMTTTGDVIYSSPGSTPVRLGIGSAGQLMTVSGAGVPSWATPASTGFNPFLIAKVTGNYLTPSFLSALADNRSSTEDVTLYTPIFITSASFDRIAILTGPSHTGTGTIRLGLYNMDATTFRPSTLVFDAGTVSANAASTVFEITISQTVSTTGYYYLAFNVQNSTGNTRFYGHGGGTPLGITSGATIMSTFSENLANTQKGFKETGVTGAFTTAGTLTQNLDPIPLIGMRYA